MSVLVAATEKLAFTVMELLARFPVLVSYDQLKLTLLVLVTPCNTTELVAQSNMVRGTISVSSLGLAVLLIMEMGKRVSQKDALSLVITVHVPGVVTE